MQRSGFAVLGAVMGRHVRAAGSFAGGILLCLSLAAVCSGQQQTVYNNFSSSGSASSNGWCLSGPNGAGCTTLATRYIAAPFTPAASYTLSGIDLALANVGGTNGAVINLRSNSGGQPGSILQTWTVSGLSSYLSWVVASVNSTSNVTLQSGQMYWVEVEPLAPDTMNYWATNSIGLGGGLTNINNAGWTALSGYGGQTLPAFDVRGVPVSTGSPGTLSISPASLTFNMTYGGPLPPSQNVTFTSSSGTISWYPDIISCVSLSPWGGSVTQGSPTSVAVVVSSCGGMAVGAHTYTVQVTYGSQVATLTVTLNVVAPTAGTLGISPASLTFNMTPGGQLPPNQNVTFTSSSGTIAWSLSGVVPTPPNYYTGGVVTLSPSSGSVTQGSPTTVSVGISNSGLAIGSYSFEVLVSYGSQLATFYVTLNVVAPTPDTLVVSPSLLSFTAAPGQVPPPQNVTISSSSGTLLWTVAAVLTSSAPANWISASPTGGSASPGNPGNTTVTISSVVSSFPAGTYTASVNVTTGTQLKTAFVSLSVTPNGLLPNQTALVFAALVNAPGPPGQTLQVNTLGAALPFSTQIALDPTTPAPYQWLSVSPPAGGPANLTAPTSLNVSVQASGLVVPQGAPAATYIGYINLTGAPCGLPDPPCAVKVTLMVKAVPDGTIAFSYQIGGALPQPQTYPLQSGNAVSVLTGAGSDRNNWLSVSPPAFMPPDNFTVTASPGSLPAGQYQGIVEFTDLDLDTAVDLVTLTITAPASTIAVAPSSLQFAYTAGGTVPAAQSIQVTNSGGGTLNWSAIPSASWLSVATASGTAPSTLSVMVSPTGLSAGTHTGSVQISAAGTSNSPVSVAVTFTVTAAPVLTVSPQALTFNYTVGGAVPAAQGISIANGGGGTLSWTAAADSAWVGLSAASGTAPATLSVSVNPANLPAGTYPGTVRLSATGATGSPASMPVTLVVQTPQPTVSITSVVNGASFHAGFASAAWVSIFGTNLAQTTRLWQGGDFVNGQLPTSLNGVSVTIDGLPAYVEYISPTQVNVLAPDDATVGTVQIQVTTALGKTNSFTTQKQQFAPAFFTIGGSYAAALHADYTYVAKPGLLAGVATQPAKPGETILIFGTGFGPTNPPLPSAQLVTAPAVLANSVQFTIGGVAAPVVYAGLVEAGLYQFNVTVPNVPDGDAAVVAQIGGVQTQTGVLITTQH